MAQLVQPPMSRVQLVDDKGMPTTPYSRFMQKITDALNGTSGVAAPNVKQVTLGTGVAYAAGTGSPEGVVPGNIGDEYTNLSGTAGTTKWVKNSDVSGSNIGWAAIA